MKFTALPVSEGDCFLLSSDSTILVDTGKDTFECSKFVNEKTKVLDLVIITHYDADHVNGILELIKSNITIKEIWLPDNFGRINETMKEEKINLLKKIAQNDEDNTKSIIIPYLYSIPENEYVNEDTMSMDLISCIKCIDYYEYLELTHMNGKKTNLRKLKPDFFPYIKKSHINLIDKIITECTGRNIPIRWLKNTDEYEEIKINHAINMYGLNCKENKDIKAYIDDIEIMYSLSRINRDSLVFKYDNDELPNVLFSADSGFEFVSKGGSIPLKDNSIVTAAHHGSADKLNTRTYGLVLGKGLIYVRSDSKNKDRPGAKYVSLTNDKYCTICNLPSSVLNEVELDYNSGNWKEKNTECNCTFPPPRL